MKGLTAKEEEIMGFFWEKGPLFVKEMLAFYEEPKPHFNTLSTIVRGLEEKGFLAHYTFGNTYQYYPVVSEEDGGARWSTCFTFLVFSIVFMGDLFYIGNFIVNKLWG